MLGLDGSAADIRTTLNRLNEAFPLAAPDQYIGIEDADFHRLVETYWRADLNATAALWAVNAIQEVRKQFMTVNAVEKSQLDAIATELEAGHVRELEQAVTTLQDAAVALQTGAEAYVRGV